MTEVQRHAAAVTADSLGDSGQIATIVETPEAEASVSAEVPAPEAATAEAQPADDGEAARA